jgi:hypothetical protein
MVQDALVLDFECAFESDDLEECRDHAAEIQRLHGSSASVVLIWDGKADRDLLVE